MQEFLRPMSTSQVLDRTFFLYRRNFVLFAGIAIVGPGLSLIASFIQLSVFGMPPMLQPGQMDPSALPEIMQRVVVQTIAGAILGLLFYTVGQALATGATMHAVSMVHLGKPTTIAESYRAIKPIFGRILRILLSIYWRCGWLLVAAYVGLFALLIGLIGLTRKGAAPGVSTAFVMLAAVLIVIVALLGGVVLAVYVYCRYSLAIPACTIEKLPARDAMARSRSLVQGSLGRVLGVYLLTAVMSAVLATVLQLPAYFTVNIFSMKPGMQITPMFMFWSLLGGFLGRTLASPIATIAIALLYYDQRVRKEAFDLQLMMDSLGQPITPPPPPLSSTATPGLG